MNAPQEKTTDPLTATMLDNLEKQMQLCKGFLCLLQEEHKALVAMDVDGLMRFSRKKEELLQHIHQLDDSIRDTTMEIARDRNSDSKTLTEIIPLLSGRTAETFDIFRKKLGAVREEILMRNLINKRFTEDTLNFLNDAISLITSGHHKHSVYAGHGPAPSKNRTAAMVSKEV